MRPRASWASIATPTARKVMKGRVYEVAKDADYNAGTPFHDKPFYFIEVRIPAGRLDLLANRPRTDT